MALARLTGFGSLILASIFALLVPAVEGAGPSVLLGWVAVAVLALAVIAGETTGLVLAAALFVVRIGMLAPLDGPLNPPVWVQGFLVVLIVELALISIEQRSRPRFALLGFFRSAVAGMVALAVALVLESAVSGFTGGGSILRVAAIAALTMMVGWVLWMWRRAVSQPPSG